MGDGAQSVVDLESEMERVKTHYKSKIASMMESHAGAIDTTVPKQDHESALQAISTEHDANLQSLGEKHLQEMQDTNERHAVLLQGVKDSHSLELTELRKDLEVKQKVAVREEIGSIYDQAVGDKQEVSVCGRSTMTNEKIVKEKEVQVELIQESHNQESQFSVIEMKEMGTET